MFLQLVSIGSYEDVHECREIETFKVSYLSLCATHVVGSTLAVLCTQAAICILSSKHLKKQ
jgi:hypothetical protein